MAAIRTHGDHLGPLSATPLDPQDPTYRHRLPTLEEAQRLGFQYAKDGEWCVDRWRCVSCGQTPGDASHGCAGALAYAALQGIRCREDLR